MSNFLHDFSRDLKEQKLFDIRSPMNPNEKTISDLLSNKKHSESKSLNHYESHIKPRTSCSPPPRNTLSPPIVRITFPPIRINKVSEKNNRDDQVFHTFTSIQINPSNFDRMVESESSSSSNDQISDLYSQLDEKDREIENLKSQLKSTKNSIKQIHNFNDDDQQNILIELKKEINIKILENQDQMKLINSLTEQLQNKSEIETLQNKLDSTTKELIASQCENKQLKNEIEKANQQLIKIIESQKQDYEELQDLKKSQQEISILHEQLIIVLKKSQKCFDAKEKDDNELNELRMLILSFEKQNKDLSDKLEISDDFLQRVQQKVRELAIECDELHNHVGLLMNSQQNQNEKKIHSEVQTTKEPQKLNSIETSLDHSKSEIRQLKNQLDQAKHNFDSSQELSEKELRENTKEIQKLRIKLEHSEEQNNDLRNQLEYVKQNSARDRDVEMLSEEEVAQLKSNFEDVQHENKHLKDQLEKLKKEVHMQKESHICLCNDKEKASDTKQELIKAKAEIKELNDQLKMMKHNLKSLHEESRKKLMIKTKEVQTLTMNLKQSHKENGNLKNSIGGISQKDDEINKLKSDLDQACKYIQNLRSKVKSYKQSNQDCKQKSKKDSTISLQDIQYESITIMKKLDKKPVQVQKEKEINESELNQLKFDFKQVQQENEALKQQLRTLPSEFSTLQKDYNKALVLLGQLVERNEISHGVMLDRCDKKSRIS